MFADLIDRFVCAMKTESNRTVRFRNYLRPGESMARFQTCSIWEAARATSAAPFYFPTATVNGQKYWDGAIQHNNPIEEVWAEKGDVRPRCVVSLGTGISARKEGKSCLPVIGRVKQLAKNLTQTEERHRLFEKKMKGEDIPYFRFNPTTGNDAIGLADYQKLDLLEAHTLEYLAKPEVDAAIRECATVLMGPPNEEDGVHSDQNSHIRSWMGVGDPNQRRENQGQTLVSRRRNTG